MILFDLNHYFIGQWYRQNFENGQQILTVVISHQVLSSNYRHLGDINGPFQGMTNLTLGIQLTKKFKSCTYMCILYMPFTYVQPHLLLVIGLLLFGPSFLNTGPFDKNMDSSSSFTLLQTSTGTFISI